MIKLSKTMFHQKSKGVGLIEILVSILVLGVGALGVATMQLTGLKFNTGSYARTQAIFLANDMMDRMRANRDLANSSPIYNTNGFFIAEDIGTPADCYTTVCSPEDLVDFDRFYFLTQVQNVLPFGSAEISSQIQPGTNSRLYEISFEWRNVANREDRDGVTLDDADETQRFSFVSVL